MKSVRPYLIAWIIPFVFAGTCLAQPALSAPLRINGQTLYRDTRNNKLYYYLPSGYQLATDNTGKPDFTLLEMRYTGTRSGGDQGKSAFHNLLRFRIIQDPGQLKKNTELKTALLKQVPGADLRPLPVRKFYSVLVWAGDSVPDSARAVKPTYEESPDESEGDHQFWTERTISLRLSNTDAQLIEAALKAHQAPMSFAYAAWSAFSDSGSFTVSGLPPGMGRYFDEAKPSVSDSTLQMLQVKGDAIPLQVNPDTWPDLVQKVDINDRVPARYPLFDVYCYDFNNALRADLYARKIEIKATSVNGSQIVSAFTFKSARPDQYVRNIRFPYAVRFDKSFFYKITDITLEGESQDTGWIERKEWSEILDITSPPDKQVRKPGSETDQ